MIREVRDHEIPREANLARCFDDCQGLPAVESVTRNDRARLSRFTLFKSVFQRSASFFHKADQSVSAVRGISVSSKQAISSLLRTTRRPCASMG